MRSITESNYPFQAAGRVWVVPELRLQSLPDGSTGVSMQEFGRIHRAIANQICGSPGPLSAAEFEFLCDLVDVPYAQIAAMVGLDRSALTKWMGAGKPMRVDRSNLLKQWFMLRIFEHAVGRSRLPLSQLAEQGPLLERLREVVLRRGAASPIHEQGAPPGRRRGPLYLPQLSTRVAPMVDGAAAVALGVRLRRGKRTRDRKDQ